MKKLIKELVIILITMTILLITLVLIDKNVRKNNMETAKIGVNWKTNTCYLYWE